MRSLKEHKLLSHQFPEQVFDYLKSTHRQMFLRGRERLCGEKRSLTSKIGLYSRTITQGQRLN
ncbi:hypothetical protein BT93_F0129 [Corymbia citriodora subsp. variegata]|nr:hypothetical protein BT93_F0129 [Corymbia citriodora subsp. variegata]